MIIIHEAKLKVGQLFIKLPPKLENRLHIPKGSVESVRILRESLDARKKPELYRVFSLEVESSLSDEELLLACKKAGVKAEISRPKEKTSFPLKKEGQSSPVVVGFGPCGMFAALTLAKMGLRPIVLERGFSMEKRIDAVENFWNGGALNPRGNVQFGEGGAGTFSDGKLTTGTKSPYREFVLNTFVDAGASPDILYKQKPHIGTDVLRNVVVNIRKHIEDLGGEVRFETQMTRPVFADGKIKGVVLGNMKDDEAETISCDKLILALGHSARDSVRTLYDMGIKMEPKAFSMGVRIEHPQDLIDIAQYGAKHEDFGLDALGPGPADYKLNVRVSDGRGVYTFCMCPGGFVVNASSFARGVVTNGMSNSNRASGKANSALLCDVRPDDFDDKGVLGGIAFQEKYEGLAFEAGGANYSLPKEDVKSFVSEKSLLKTCLPDFVYDDIKEALPLLDKKLKGFADPSALMYGIESRSSSPVRILRDESLQAEGINGLYPAGEGAGYAGGIMSAACDGVRVAFKVAEDYE